MRRRNTWKERCLSWQTGYSPQTTHIIGSKGHFVVFCCVGRSLGISAKSEVLWHLVEVFKAMYHLSPLTWLVTYITACIGRDRNSEATWLLTSTNIDSDNDNDFSTVRRFVSVLLAVCLSVCLSVTLVYCIQTATDVLRLFSQPRSPIILVLWAEAPLPNSKGNPTCGELSRGYVWKISNFWPISSSYLNWER